MFLWGASLFPKFMPIFRWNVHPSTRSGGPSNAFWNREILFGNAHRNVEPHCAIQGDEASKIKCPLQISVYQVQRGSNNFGYHRLILRWHTFVDQAFDPTPVVHYAMAFPNVTDTTLSAPPVSNSRDALN